MSDCVTMRKEYLRLSLSSCLLFFCMCVFLAAAEVDYNISRKDDKCDIYGSGETMKFIWCHVSLERNLESHFNYQLWTFNL